MRTRRSFGPVPQWENPRDVGEYHGPEELITKEMEIVDNGPTEGDVPAGRIEMAISNAGEKFLDSRRTPVILGTFALASAGVMIASQAIKAL